MKFLASLLTVCVVAMYGYAQTKADVFNTEVPFTYLGIDLSQAKLIGDRERYGSESDMRRLTEEWNNIFLKEPEKFNVAKAFGRKSLENKIEITKDNNLQLDVRSLYTDDPDEFAHLTLGDLNNIIRNYDFAGTSGLGMMFVVESFSKPNAKAMVWVTFINLGTREVVFAQQMTGDPGGFGLRNYWANAFSDILQKIQRKEFPKWKKLHTSS